MDEVLDVLRQHGALVAAFHWRRSNPPADTADPLAALGPVAVPTLRLPEQETARLCAEVEAHLRAHRVLGG